MMTKEKLIEEIARVICDDCAGDAPCEHRMCDAVLQNAKAFYNAGYRKASDIVLEAIDEMKERLKKFVDNDISLHSSLPCCSVLWHFTDGIDQIASQLKKKYTEET